MKKEDFAALGIPEELAEKAAEASANELKGFVPRERMNEANQAKTNAETAYNDVKAELEKLKASAGSSEDLQKQISGLQEELKKKEKTHADEMAELKMTNAIQAEIAGRVRDAGIVAGLLDRSKLILAEDGKVTGLEEQLKELKESKSFLFMEGETYPNVNDKGEVNKGAESGGTRAQFAEWAAEMFKGGN